MLLDRYTGHAQRDPDGLAVVAEDGASYSHEALWSTSTTWSQQLLEAVGSGRQLAVCWLPNVADYQPLFVAILRAGLVPCTIPSSTDVGTLVSILDSARASIVVCEDDEGAIATAIAAADASRYACEVFSTGNGRFTQVATTGGDRPEPHAPDTAHIMFTSSTTGAPKAVVHSESTLAALNLGFADRFGLDDTTPIFMPSPLGHSVGGIHGIRLALYLGAPLVLQRHWDPQRAIELANRYRCDFTCAATPFLKDLVDAPTPEGGRKFATVRTFLCGGAQVPPALLDAAETELPHTFVSVLWGMTEGGVTTCVPGDPREKTRETAGCGLPGLELLTLGRDGEPLPAGGEGELAMRGPGVFVEYLGREDLNRALFTEEGFFRTGDRATIDSDGYVCITGRLKDLIIRGGVNISPVPIENALFRHPDVRAVAVVGAPDERLGERLCAIVQADRPLTLREVTDWCEQEGLPKRLWPERLELVTDMPRTAAGKIRKHQLRDEVLESSQGRS